jgi:hypothetical protein
MCSYTRYPHLAAKPRPLLPPDVATQKNAVTLNCPAVTVTNLQFKTVSYLIFKRRAEIEGAWLKWSMGGTCSAGITGRYL